VDGIEFFTHGGNGREYKLPVVNLEHASDNEYPPQKKAFEMLKVKVLHGLLEKKSERQKVEKDFAKQLKMLKGFST